MKGASEARHEPTYTPNFLERLHRYGAGRVETVRFRRNRRTIWSLTGSRTRLNLHEAYREAPDEIVRAFSVIVRNGGRSSHAYQEAVRTAKEWQGIVDALSRMRQEDRDGGLESRRVAQAGTAHELAEARRLYQEFNTAHFKDRLPDDILIRLSARMSSRLGHMAIRAGSPRTVREIALNVRLMLPENIAARRETLLHEMAHVAAYLFDGDAGHGPAWKAWARRVGCEPRRSSVRGC